MRNTIQLAQIVVSVLLIIFILLQAKGTGLGSALGGSGEMYRSKRGVEKIVYKLTIVFIVLFATLSLALALIK